MNRNSDLRTIQRNIINHTQKSANGKIDAMKWESLEEGALRLLLYTGEKQSVLEFTKEDLQGYILKGWDRRFRETLPRRNRCRCP